MTLQEKIYDTCLTVVMASTGIASTLSDIEQVFRILLLFVSIISGLLLILVNWEKGINQLKKFFRKNGEQR